ncbi:methyltransferase [Leptolyngbya sp. 'hensonii']|nr:methyltransferase [Leptolyngbya sp. 'hensonii']
MQMITGMWVTQSIYVAASLGIADLLQGGVRSVDELAQASGAQAPHLYRVLRALASVGIFTEVAPGQFGLTAIAEYLRSDVPGSLRALSRTVSDTWQWNCWGDILNIVKTGQPAMQRLYQVQDTFTYLTQNPESGAIFDDAMTGWAKTIHTAVIDAYDFSGVQTLVDIAGGHGMLLASILAANPMLRGILFDLPNVVAGAGPLLEQAQVLNRCQIQGGSFFAAIPTGGDAYLMSHILHDWGDADCVRILQNIRQAIAEQGRLLIVEMVIPPGDTPHFGKFLDVDMMAIFSGGRERTAAEYQELFQAAGFQLNRIIPTAAPVSVIEGVCA